MELKQIDEREWSVVTHPQVQRGFMLYHGGDAVLEVDAEGVIGLHEDWQDRRDEVMSVLAVLLRRQIKGETDTRPFHIEGFIETFVP